MPFGDAILNLIGQKDPRLAILTAMQQGGGGSTPATPAAGGATPVSGGTGGGTAAPAAPQQPAVYQSPPDLAALYGELLKRQRKEDMIDKGIGLIGASLAHPENRQMIMDAYGGGSGSGGSSGKADPMNFISGMMQFQEKNRQLQERAAMRAALPNIAKQYGLSLDTAQYLFDSGGLDDVIKKASEPNKQIVENADGTHSIVDVSDGTIGTAFGVPKKRDIEIVKADNGDQFAVYKDTGERVGQNNIVTGTGSTENEKLWRADEADRKERGLPTRSLSEFIQTTGRARAGASNLGATGIDYGDPPKDMAWKRDAKGSIAVDEQGRPMAVAIAGGPLDISNKAAEEADATKAANQSTSTGLLGQNIDDAMTILDRNKDALIGAAGLTGSVAKYLPESEAATLATKLETVKANMTFDQLSQMRKESKTGASGLGQLSDTEGKLLAAVKGSLVQSQRPEELAKNLLRIQGVTNLLVNGVVGSDGKRRHVEQADVDAVIKAADEKAGAMFGGGSNEKPEIDKLLKKYGG
jgi:hypothetical protein